MIKEIYIDNFKSLVEFRLVFSQFTCLVGLNGAGKSTVLQAMDFLSQLMRGDLNSWLKQRQWESGDIKSKLTPKSNIEFKLVLNHVEFGDIVWSGSINRLTLNCTKERVEISKVIYLRVEDGQCAIAKINHTETIQDKKTVSNLDKFPIVFDYQGSILSILKDSQSNPILQALKEAVIEIRSLDLLSPELLRGRAKSAEGKLGLGGEKLSAFIHESGKDGKDKLRNELAQVYGQLTEIETKSLRSGWKQLEITEKFGDQVLKSTARHMNDGMLRLMAVLAQLEAGKNFLLFDEIENGINPELIEYLIDHLVNTQHQILVTTHSPMILNFLSSDVARKSVIYLYKNAQGHTQSVRLFDIPSMAKKLEFMGPGEVFIDTDLTHLYQEIATIEIQ